MVREWFYLNGKKDIEGVSHLSRPYRILILARSYPNTLLPELGLWVKRLVHHCAGPCELKVISPVPYFPPVKSFERYSRFRNIERHSIEDSVEIFHPRFLVGFGRSLYLTEAFSYYLGVRSTIDKLHRQSAFDLIHAHFIYPDGVVGAWLGQRYNIPVVVTEHAPWMPNWIDKNRLVRWQAVNAAKKCAFLISVSSSVKDTIVHFTGQPEKIRVIPIGVDGSFFTAPKNGDIVKKNQVLYVGFINFNKGVDLLLKAIKCVLKTRPDTKLVMVGGGFYNDTMKQERCLHAMAEDMGLDGKVEFTGIKSPAEVAKYMKESAFLVLPSRAESFGAVLVEALACGRPVIATRCGGPEDIVNDNVGVLIPREDPTVLAHTIEQMLARQQEYNSVKIRDYAIEKFSWGQVAKKTINLYKEIIQK